MELLSQHANHRGVFVSQQTWFIIAMVIYLLAMLAIGLYSFRQTDEYDDYMLGGRGLHPFVAALSAGASDMSGWLLMGLPGAMYVSGFGQLWMPIGLLIGCWANWKWTAPRLRSYTEIADNSITIPSFLEKRLDDKTHALRIAAGLIILTFFTFYVASGMVSGGKYFQSTFGGDYLVGMLVIACVTVAYTFIGGFLAVSYTDTVQGLIMFIALILVPTFALLHMNDAASIWTYQTEHNYGFHEALSSNPHWFSLFNGVSFITAISGLAWGLGYFGQPHIIVRFMALRKPSEARSGRRYGVAWMFLCIIGATMVAVIGPAFFGKDPSIHIDDTVNYETIFLDMGQILFHPLIAGLILTAVLAAIMSTIASQLLVVSSALVEDIYNGLINKNASHKTLINLSRAAVIMVAVVAALLALDPNSQILNLVSFAWAGFGSAFGPMVVAALYWRRLNYQGALAGMVTGAVVAFVWGQWIVDTPFGNGLYEMIPGVICSTIAIIAVTLATPEPEKSITEGFDEASRLARVAEANPELNIATAQEKIEEGSIKA